MTHAPAKSAVGAGIEARMQVGRDVGSAHCASEALVRVQDWAPVRVCDLSAGCVQVGGEAQQLLPGQQGPSDVMEP
jgi:hypothetical protein